MTTNTALRTTAQPQLTLVINGDHAQYSWELDDETKETGRRGLAMARAALRATRPVYLDEAA